MNKRLDLPLTLKAVDDAGTFSGYASVFGVKDSHEDIVMPGAFVESLQKRMPAMLWQHDSREPIGVYTKVAEDEKGLYIEGKLLIESDPLAKRAHGLLKQNALSGLSVGYRLEDYDYDAEKEAFMLKKMDLFEVSLVTFPSNEEARIQNVKNSLAEDETPSPVIVERLLRDAGFSRQRAKAFMAKGYSGIGQREADNSAEIEATIKRLTAKIKG